MNDAAALLAPCSRKGKCPGWVLKVVGAAPVAVGLQQAGSVINAARPMSCNPFSFCKQLRAGEASHSLSPRLSHCASAAHGCIGAISLNPR